ncbi:hypothetical protein GMMP15_1650012 [Candidatus Magnetomoraceae bacterium gMMP-15]
MHIASGYMRRSIKIHGKQKIKILANWTIVSFPNLLKLLIANFLI